MSDATKAMRDFLAKSPSVVFPEDVMELLIPVERENAELRDTTYAWRMVDRLSSENARLREQADFEHFQLGEMKRAVGMMLDEFDELAKVVTILAAENERLCALIKKTWKWEKNGCYECPLEKDCKVLCVYDGDCGIAVEIEKELQELGIEVNA